MNNEKRVLGILLSLAMILTMMPPMAFAASGQETHGFTVEIAVLGFNMTITGNGTLNAILRLLQEGTFFTIDMF